MLKISWNTDSDKLVIVWTFNSGVPEKEDVLLKQKEDKCIGRAVWYGCSNVNSGWIS